VVGLPALEAAMGGGWPACPGGYVVWLACLPWRRPWYVVGLPALEEVVNWPALSLVIFIA